MKNLFLLFIIIIIICHSSIAKKKVHKAQEEVNAVLQYHDQPTDPHDDRSKLLKDWISEQYFYKKDNIIQPPTSKSLEGVSKIGYHFSRHHIMLSEWKLEVIRIYSNEFNENQINNRPVVFLQHGLLDTCGTFISIGADSLAFTLAQHGYDVFLGNTRGNSFSRKHGTCENDRCKDKKRWLFTFEDHALLDFRAMLKKVAEVRNNPEIHAYIGHSMGGLMYAYGYSGLEDGAIWTRARDELDGVKLFSKVKVKHFIGLSPAIYVHNFKYFLKGRLREMHMNWAHKIAGRFEFGYTSNHYETATNPFKQALRKLTQGANRLRRYLGPKICKATPPLCKAAFCFIAGCSKASTWDSKIHDISKFAPGQTDWSVLRGFHLSDKHTKKLVKKIESKKPLTPRQSSPLTYDWDGLKHPEKALRSNRQVYSKLPAKTCCKLCKNGIPCGDTCIDKNEKCNKADGCACKSVKNPRYDLCRLIKKTNTKMTIFYSDYDPLVRPEAVFTFAHEMNRCDAEKVGEQLELVHVKNFGHLDFTLGSNLRCDGELTPTEKKKLKPYLPTIKAPESVKTVGCKVSINNHILEIIQSKESQQQETQSLSL